MNEVIYLTVVPFFCLCKDDARFEDEAHLYTGPEFDELDLELQVIIGKNQHHFIPPPLL